jgi:hypothetical protein
MIVTFQRLESIRGMMKMMLILMLMLMVVTPISRMDGSTTTRNSATVPSVLVSAFIVPYNTGTARTVALWLSRHPKIVGPQPSSSSSKQTTTTTRAISRLLLYKQDDFGIGADNMSISPKEDSSSNSSSISRSTTQETEEQTNIGTSRRLDEMVLVEQQDSHHHHHHHSSADVQSVESVKHINKILPTINYMHAQQGQHPQQQHDDDDNDYEMDLDVMKLVSSEVSLNYFIAHSIIGKNESDDTTYLSSLMAKTTSTSSSSIIRSRQNAITDIPINVILQRTLDTIEDVAVHLRRIPYSERAVSGDDNQVLVLTPEQQHGGRKTVVVLGSGWAAHALMKVVDCTKVRLIIVSPSNHFVFTPMLASASVGTVEYRSMTEAVRAANPCIDGKCFLLLYVFFSTTCVYRSAEFILFCITLLHRTTHISISLCVSHYFYTYICIWFKTRLFGRESY